MFARRIILFLFILIFSSLCFAQENDSQAKYTAVNFMVERIYFTRLGLIVYYYAEGRFQYLYLPNKFFNDGIAIKIKEGDGKITPQMSIIFKNFEPVKVKLYVPFVFDGPRYRIMDYLTKTIEDKFNSTEKIEVTIFQDKKTE